MQTKRQDLFTTIRTEGAILPPDLLQRVAAEDRELGGLSPTDYHLSGEKLNEAINRSWNRLLGAWTAFRTAPDKLPANDMATSITREKWLMPLFAELGYGRLVPAKSITIEDRSYPISHAWQYAPIHLVGCRIDLDRRAAGVAGASRSSPHSLVQELLNREPERLWGFVSNGHRLRVLRDNRSLTRQTYVEFDLQAMMAGQVYPDFKLLWLLCHESRVEGDKPADCWLEKWSQTAVKQGTRALDQLRDGVQKAIEAIGRGFLAHPGNKPLRDKLQAGTLDKQDYYRQLLRLVYRMIFLFVAEDRDLLFFPGCDAKARDRYLRFYSTQCLRNLAGKLRGTPHADLYYGLRLIFAKLDATGCPELGLPALGSFLWSADRAAPDLAAADLANRDLLDATRELAYTTDQSARRPVDYRNLGAEELGSIYESLLELHPDLNTEAGTFALRTAAGHERKTTGSYYTPTSLVNCLLDSALEPVLDEAVKGGPGYEDRGATPEQRILSLKVCDPACGSGHFLIAAAHRIAKRLAAIRTGDEEPAPDAYRHALRDVIGHCIYGVDLNPMAVELCKVSLWMEALEPGRPLSFLDHRIQVGNSLIGTTPALLARGIPDAAFEPIEGDDRALCRAFKKQNKDERKGQMHLFHGHQPWDHLGSLATSLAQVDAVNDETIDGVRLKQRSYEELVKSSTYETGRLLADALCAAFVWKKTKEFDYPITEAVFRRIEKNPHDIAPWMKDEIRRLARQYQFFHWHLAFPDAFRPDESEPDSDICGWSNGFDAVLGNPPWEQVQVDPQEFFAATAPSIAGIDRRDKREAAVEALRQTDPDLVASYEDEKRAVGGTQHFFHDSGRFPLAAAGRLNSAPLFLEVSTTISSASGRVGLIIPTGIATDTFTRHLFGSLVSSGCLRSLFDFENEDFLFPNVHHAMRFCLITLGPRRTDSAPATFMFFARQVPELNDGERRFTLTAADFRLLNPNTGTCPVFRLGHDVTLLRGIASKVPVFVDEASGQNPWEFSGFLMFMMDTGESVFRDAESLLSGGYNLEAPRWRRGDDFALPLLEGKMIHHYDHRFGTYAGQTEGQSRQGKLPESTVDDHQQASYFTMPRYWVPDASVSERVGDRWDRNWYLSWRDITNAKNERTVIASIIPLCAAGDTLPLALIASQCAEKTCALLANLCAFILDYTARQKVSGMHLRFNQFQQLPILPPSAYGAPAFEKNDQNLLQWILPRSLELSYTAWDLEPFGSDCGYAGPPFIWDEERRFLIRCELDAAYFHLYDISRDDVDYIMETFPIVKRKDIEKHGCYHTKDMILEIYDAMAEAARTGVAYQTRLDPPPGPPADAAGNFLPMAQWTAWPAHIHPPKPKLKAGAAQQAAGDLMLQVYAFLYVAGVPVEIEVMRRAVILMQNDTLRRAYLDGTTPTRTNITSVVSFPSLRSVLRSNVKAGNLVTDGDIDGTAQVSPNLQNAPSAASLKAIGEVGQKAFLAAEEAKRALVALRGRERTLDQLAEVSDETSTEAVRRG